MVPTAYPFLLKDVFQEVYWVDGYFGEEGNLPPENNGTVFRWEQPISDPLPLVDIEGHTGRQRYYSHLGISLNRMAYDSNFMALSVRKSRFLGYEHRVPIILRRAVHGYSTWDQVKALVEEAYVLSLATVGFRNRPSAGAERDLYGNAYLGSSKYYDAVNGGNPVTGVKWAFLGHHDRRNIPCGRGLFVYRTLTNGLIAEAQNQFCDPISAVFTKYTVNGYGDVTTSQQTLYYHPVDNLWKDAVGGSPVTGYYAHDDILPGGPVVGDPSSSFAYQISAGNITENKLYLPEQIAIKVLLAEGEWVDGTKNVSVAHSGSFSGIGYRVEGELLSEPFLEAVVVFQSYRHETSIPYTYWGDNAKFWNAVDGSKTTEAVVERVVPYIG